MIDICIRFTSNLATAVAEVNPNVRSLRVRMLDEDVIHLQKLEEVDSLEIVRFCKIIFENVLLKETCKDLLDWNSDISWVQYDFVLASTRIHSWTLDTELQQRVL